MPSTLIMERRYGSMMKMRCLGNPGQALHGMSMRTVRLAAALFLFCILMPGAACPQETVLPGETLDLGHCITIALAHHPGMLGAEGGLKASTSRVDEARSGYYPQVSAASAYSRSHPADTTDKKGVTGNNYLNSVDVSQNIFDFGRTSTQVKVQSLGAEASRGDLSDTERQVVFDVKLAYYTILQAKLGRDNYTEAVRILQLHLDQARKFYSVGIKSKIDVTNAEVNLGQARLNFLNSENRLVLAKISLKNAMGLPDAPTFDVADEPGYREYPAELASALQKAYEQRPDLISAQARKEASKRSVDLAGKDYYPTLSGNAGYGWSGSDYPLDEGWSVGVTLDFPLFNGFLTRSRVEEARGNLQTAEAQVLLVKQNIRLEVEQAYYNLQNVREKISLAELTLRQAKENRELAMGRYSSGVGSSIEVADAVLTEVDAKTAYNVTLFEYRLAVASLEKATGENR
jgi:outer membrane protein